MITAKHVQATGQFMNAQRDINCYTITPPLSEQGPGSQQEEMNSGAFFKGPIGLLRQHSSIGSLLDANERFDPPKCSEDTRTLIMNTIIDWVESDSKAAEVLWLVGPVGAGKSALAQSLAELCHKNNNFASAVFISRTAPSPRRSDGNRVIPTTVLQLVDALPDLRPFVEKAIAKDPFIFQKNRAIQLTSLLLNPLRKIRKRTLSRLFRKLGLLTLPRLIVIDGLDECSDKAIQMDLIHLMSNAVSDIALPFRILICSRPEAHIVQAFNEAFHGINLKTVDLAKDPSIDADLMDYLHKIIAEIRRSHPLKDDLDPDWPSHDDLSRIVRKSSPQFIYASVVGKYISDHDFRPDQRLQIILKVIDAPPSDKPYASLDPLYSFIFRSIPKANRETVNNILSVLYLSGQSGYPYLTEKMCSEGIEGLLRLNRGDVKRVLQPLLSLLHVPKSRENNIKVYHASLFDYLTDPTRPGELHLNVQSCHVQLAAHCLDNLLVNLSSHQTLRIEMDAELFAFIIHWSNGACDSTAVCYDFRDFMLRYCIGRDVDGKACKEEIARIVYHLRFIQKHPRATPSNQKDARNLVAFILRCTAYYHEALLRLTLRCSCAPVAKDDPDFLIFEPTLEILKIENDFEFELEVIWSRFYDLEFQFHFENSLRSTTSLVELDISVVLSFPVSILDCCSSLKRLSISTIVGHRSVFGAFPKQANPRRILDYLSISDHQDSVESVLRWFRYSSVRYSYDANTIVKAAGRNLTQDEIHDYTTMAAATVDTTAMVSLTRKGVPWSEVQSQRRVVGPGPESAIDLPSSRPVAAP